MNYYSIHTGAMVTSQKSPLDKEEDVWLQPSDTTDVAPPSFDLETQTCRFNGTEWIVEAIPEPEELEPDATDPDDYRADRYNAYGNVQEQIEFITENGLEAWQTKVAEIKEKYPKP